MSGAFSSMAQRVNDIDPSVTLAISAKAAQLAKEGVDVISYALGEPDFATADHIIEAAREACLKPENYHYTDTQGLLEFREAIAKDFARSAHYEVDPQQIVVTNGGKQAAFETIQALLGPNDDVIVPMPCWTSYEQMIKLAGARVIPVITAASNHFEPTINDIESATTDATKAIILVSPNNPSGAVYSKETLLAIGKWALERQIWVIVDSIYEHLVYDEAQVYHLGDLLPQLRDQVVEINGLAKAYAMTGWRVGWSVAPFNVAKAIKTLQGHMTSNVCNIAQRAGIAALTGPKDHLACMRAEFDSRRKLMVERLNACKYLRAYMPKGAFYVFADVACLLGVPLTSGRVITSAQELCSIWLEEIHLATVPGEAFGCEGFVRFSYSLDRARMMEGLDRLRVWVEHNEPLLNQ